MNSNHHQSPKLATRLLNAFLRSDLAEEVLGDLEEKFYADLRSKSAFKAKLNYWYQVLNYLRPFAVRKSKQKHLNNYSMISNYFKVGIRVIGRNKFHSVINVFGLTIGITFALLLGVFIQKELQVNQNLSDIDRLYFVENKYQAEVNWPPGLLTKEAVAQYPTLFENYYRFVDRNITISKGERSFRIQGLIGDATILKMFGFNVLHGDPSSALTHPNSIVVTEELALKYFDKTDAVGETLSVATERFGRKEYRVTAVVSEPQKGNAVTDFMNQDGNAFLPMENLKDFFSDYNTDSWNVNVISYLKLKEQASHQQAASTLNSLFKKNVQPKDADHRVIELNPLKTYYVTANNSAVQKLLYSLAAIGLFILLLAVVNFINIAIASSFSRLKEVGVRKVVGGLKNQLIVQFLVESILLSFFSGAIALLFYELAHSYFGNILSSTLFSITEFDGPIWISILITILLIGLLAGLYPAVYLSFSKPIDSLKGKLGSVTGTIYFSRVLIATQFTMTLFVFMVSIVLSGQVNFFLTKDLGYNKSSVLIVQSVPRVYSEEGFQKAESAKEEFERLPCVQKASLSWGAPGWNLSPVGGKIYLAGKTSEEGVQTDLSSVDESYLDVFQIKMKEGKFISGGGKKYKQQEIVINEAAQKALNANIGDKLKAGIFGDFEFTIVGIVKDFNYESLREVVKPLALMHNRDFSVYRYMSFKIQNSNLVESVEQIESAWKRIFPSDPFLYSFADERLRALYTTELQLKKGATIATALMIAIVAVGVLGLVSLTVSKRKKEIGIRKVLGASIGNIIQIFTKEYVILILIGFAGATSLAYWFATNWLQGFTSHISLAWWIFAIPFMAVFAFTLLIVSVRSVMAAHANPVDSLKLE